MGTQVASMKVNITDINTRKTKDGRRVIDLTVKINSIEHLKNLIAKIQKVDGVLSVERQ